MHKVQSQQMVKYVQEAFHAGHGSVLHVNLDCLANNVAVLQAQHQKQQIMCVLKANAYGHGLIPIAHFLQAQGQRLFGVAIPSEAVQLRQAGIQGRIVVLGAVHSANWTACQAQQIEVTVASWQALQTLVEYDHQQRCSLEDSYKKRASAYSEDNGKLSSGVQTPLQVHLKVDSGMHRIGVLESPQQIAEQLNRLQSVRLRGIFSHFSSAEDKQAPQFESQYGTVMSWLEGFFKHYQGNKPELHMANTAALLRDERVHFDYARAGFGLWGPTQFKPLEAQPVTNTQLQQVDNWYAEVRNVKQLQQAGTVGYGNHYAAAAGERLATIGVGYGDGYRRMLSQHGKVLIGEQRYPFAGTISMDQATISLGMPTFPPILPALPLPEQGSIAVLLGGGGVNAISLHELAAWQGSIGYEVMTSIANRVLRLYTHQAQSWNPPQNSE